MAPASPAPLSAAQIHKSIAGLAPPFGLGDRLLQKIYAVPPLRLLFFGCVVLPFQVARIAIVEVAIKGILLRGVVGGLLRLLGLKKKRAEKAPDVLTPERLDTAGRRLLGPYYEGSAEKKAEDDGLVHTKYPGSEPGIEMHVVEAGRRADPDADVILFVHGFPENWYMWNQVLKNEKLSSKYHLVAINLRGYGGSSKPLGKLNYTVTKITNDMRAVVEAVTAKKTKKSTIVVSHDWGGAASWAFSQRFPELVSRLVVINCPPASLLGRNMTWRQLSKSWYIVVFQVPGMGAALMTSNKARGLAAMFPRQDVADVHRYNALQPGAMTCMVDYYRANINEPEIKGKVRCPALVIWGLNDIALDPTTCLADLDKYIMEDPGKMEMRILEDTGHFVVDERPELVVDLIEEWLGSKDK